MRRSVKDASRRDDGIHCKPSFKRPEEGAVYPYFNGDFIVKVEKPLFFNPSFSLSLSLSLAALVVIARAASGTARVKIRGISDDTR